jgi:hypothetical protein
MLRLRQEDLEFREIEGEVVALDLKTSSYIGINQTGGSLWQLLVDGTDEEVLVRHLVEKFGIDESQAESDIRNFLADLRNRGLLVEDA